MAAPEVKQTQIAIDLPGSLSELRQYYHLKPADGATSLEGRWDKAWAKYHIAAATRDDSVASAPYAQTWEPKAPFVPNSREYELTLGAVKVSISATFATAGLCLTYQAWYCFADGPLHAGRDLP